jgi:hypothetical protein
MVLGKFVCDPLTYESGLTLDSTPVGDPIEANAIGAAFQKIRSHEDPLYLYVHLANRMTHESFPTDSSP